MKRKESWLILAAVGVSVLLVLARSSIHLGYVAKDEAETAHLIEQFHDRLNAGKFDLIYDDADRSLQQTINREAYAQVLRRVLDDSGKFLKMKSSKWEVIAGPVVQIRATYESAFEKRDATERFTFVRRRKRIRLAAYSATDNQGATATQ